MSTRPTLGQRLRYRFDSSLSRGPTALIGYLAAVTAAVLAIFAALLLIADLGPGRNLVRTLFDELLHLLNTGQVGEDDIDDEVFIVTQLVLTLGGIVIFSALIGVITAALDVRLEELRKGRSLVLERDHTLILGWSDAIFTVISELAIANESRRNPSIVILAERDKVEMEDEIRTKVRDLHGTRVVCRTGSPIDLADLAIANPNTSRSIVVLSPDSPESDAEVIKTLLAVLRGPDRRPEPFHVVAEIRDMANLEAARLVGRDEAVLINKAETVARLIVQTSRQSGAAAVYKDLMNFDGDELYFRHDAALEGRSYRDALFAYERCCVLGVRSAADGRVQLNPPMDRVIAGGDEVVAIATDQATLLAAQHVGASVDESVLVRTPPPAIGPQQALILNFNERTAEVVAELDNYMAPGSTVAIAAEGLDLEGLGKRVGGGLKNLKVRTLRGHPTDRETLESLNCGRFAQIIVMSPGGEPDPQRADAQTLITLLHLRDIADRAGLRFTIASEMLDTRNRELAQVTEVDDVIVSDQLISLMLTQVSENPALGQVFADLFQAEGSEVYMRPAEQYVRPGSPVTFATFMHAAADRGETAFGYRRASDSQDSSANYGVIVNPAMSDQFTVAPGDRLVVLAED